MGGCGRKNEVESFWDEWEKKTPKFEHVMSNFLVIGENSISEFMLIAFPYGRCFVSTRPQLRVSVVACPAHVLEADYLGR